MKKSLSVVYLWVAFIFTIQGQAILGPVESARIVREISNNGRYVVGQTFSSKGYVWDTESGNTLVAFQEGSEAYGVTDDKFVVGIFDDPNYLLDGKPIYRSGGYSTDGSTWTSLGLGLLTSPPSSTMDASYARRVTPDGNKIAGYSRKETTSGKINASCIWVKDGAGWTVQEWAHPEDISYSSIIDIADDGNKAVGYVSFLGDGITPTAARSAILWKSPTEYELPFSDRDLYTEYICISANGKYAGYRYSGQSGFHNLETDVKTLIPQGVLINGISNNGLAVGEYSAATGTKGFVWSQETGFLDFKAYLSTYAPEFVNKSTELGKAFAAIDAADYSLGAITPDGKTFGIQLRASAKAYVLKLKSSEMTVWPYPQNLSATVSVPDRNKVTLTWEAPALNGETLTGYAIFCDDREIATVLPGALTYTDENAPEGYPSYSVKAIYGTEYSQASNEVQVAITDTYALPFKEDFASLDIRTNFWTKETEQGMENSFDWGCGGDTGVDRDEAGLIFSVNNGSGPYDASLVSKYLDGREKDKIYLSFLTKPFYALGDALTPDSLWIEVYDGTQWTTVERYTYQLVMGWKAEMVDLSPVATGKLFKVRFRVRGVNNTVNTKYLLFDDITVSTALPNGNAVPRNVLAQKKEGKVQLAWQDASSEAYALTYANTPKRYAVGNESAPFIAVNRFDASDLSIYGDLYLTSITAYLVREVAAPKKATLLKLAVFDNDTRIVNQEIIEFTANTWNTFPLNNPVLLKDKNLKFGIEVLQHDSIEKPIGVDENRNPVSGKGDLYSEDGGNTWKTLTDAGKVNNWCIIGNVSGRETAGSKDMDVVGYNVYSGGVKINDDLIFRQNLVIDSPSETGYTLRAYSIISGLSGESAVIYPSDDVAIHRPEINKPKVYPNVVSDILYIESNTAVKDISLYDAAGFLIKRTDYAVTSIPLKNLAKGLYLIKIRTIEGEKSVHKIIKN